jgi:uncharacterized protein YfaS (alpha-2-macroglobulin family)
MEFVDMSRVFPVDPALIERTAAWLSSQQSADGHFEPTGAGIAEGAINQYQGNVLRTTAYAAWALAHAHQQPAVVAAATAWLAAHIDANTDSYALALTLNLLAESGGNDALLDQVANQLVARAQVATGGEVSFSDVAPTPLAPSGDAPTLSSDLETTALVALGLFAANRSPDIVDGALLHLARNKDTFGAWEGTQATVRSLMALAATAVPSDGAGTDAVVNVSLDGQAAGSFTITTADAVVMRQLDLSSSATPGAHVVDIQQTGTGHFAYEVAATSFVPRTGTVASGITVAQTASNATLTVGDVASVAVHAVSTQNIDQALIDIPLPAGFDVDTSALDAAVAAGTLEQVELQPQRIVLYVAALQQNAPLDVSYSLRARLRGAVTLAAAKTSAYYNSGLSGQSAPLSLVVN